MTRTKQRWGDLKPSQQRAIIVAGAVEVVVTTAAVVDLARRPASGVRGPKVLWLLTFVVQPVGPVAYFAVGRR